MKAWLIGAGLVAGGMLPARPGTGFRLDAEGGIGGIRFGENSAGVEGFSRHFNGIGRRWRTTRLYGRPADTTRWHGMGAPTTYWFRQNRFIGVDYLLPSAAVPHTLQQLQALYGPARPDTLPDHWYWLGQTSYILLEKNDKRQGMLFVAGLAMLNEQVYETAVRAQARRQLGWQPDSLGLPRQFPVR